ncbi:pectin acetylesterase [Leptospira semungkisensis]|uniref:Pectin acetylesterase n=1 Tax=Leptospira semungkisensis TaxID=2484985 RepID=A0A4R9G0Y2_9LEPT|nr:pectin acetylesterase-family hydrolase [Leptospira semungkisensis]TGK05042.1 pectin acetylesterase [Leptospira semungkisensis]
MRIFAKSPFLIFALTCALGILHCKTESQDNTSQTVGLGLAVALQNPYQRINANPDTIIIPNSNATYQSPGRSYTPSCFGNAGNTSFHFYRKTVASNNKKLLINFMGGGACWNNDNCFGNNTTTFFNFLDTVPDLFVKVAFQGILDADVSTNPLKNYDVLFIPYCTGDLHFGSKDVSGFYNDPNVADASEPSFYSHRGHDNTLAVLKYIQTNYTQVTDIVVAGQSAGGYGAILNYPHIRQMFKDTATFPSVATVSLLADASNGAVVDNFYPDIVKTIWGGDANLPTWTGTISSTYLDSGGPASIQNFLSQVTSKYSTDKVGQYAAQFDSTQRWFFHVMGVIKSGAAYSDSSNFFGPGDSSEVSDSPNDSTNTPSNCNWAVNSKNAMQNTTGANYYYYIAPGDVHTITTSNDMFTLTSQGKSFNTWLANVVTNTGTAPEKVDCSLGSGSHPCTDTNYISNQYNNSLKRATSHQSFDLGQDLAQTCFP